jgi:hypothetical protein
MEKEREREGEKLVSSVTQYVACGRQPNCLYTQVVLVSQLPLPLPLPLPLSQILSITCGHCALQCSSSASLSRRRPPGSPSCWPKARPPSATPCPPIRYCTRLRGGESAEESAAFEATGRSAELVPRFRFHDSSVFPVACPVAWEVAGEPLA